MRSALSLNILLRTEKFPAHLNVDDNGSDYSNSYISWLLILQQ